jgi:hypothetical protein
MDKMMTRPQSKGKKERRIDRSKVTESKPSRQGSRSISTVRILKIERVLVFKKYIRRKNGRCKCKRWKETQEKAGDNIKKELKTSVVRSCCFVEPCSCRSLPHRDGGRRDKRTVVCDGAFMWIGFRACREMEPSRVA